MVYYNCFVNKQCFPSIALQIGPFRCIPGRVDHFLYKNFEGEKELHKQGALREFGHYAAMNILGMIGISCYILADTFFVAQGTGSLGLAALNIAIPAYNLMNGIGLMLGVGAATQYMIARAQNDQRQADSVFTHAAALGLLLGVLFLLGGLCFAQPIARLLGADGFDTAMNYLFRDAVTDCLARGRIGVSELSRRLNSALMKVTGPNGHAMYNCLGSHDTARFLTEAKGEAWRLRLAMALQMLFPGAPAIYYGDELGMTGENDPGCRGGMAWAHPDKDLLAWQKELIALRQAHPALRTGSYTPLLADDEKSLFAFARGNREEELLAVFNLGERAQTWDCAGESVHVLPHSVHILFRPVQKEEKPCVQKPSWRSSPA